MPLTHILLLISSAFRKDLLLPLTSIPSVSRNSPAREFPCKKGTSGGAKPSTRRKPHQGKALNNTNGPGLAQQHKTSSNLQQALLHPGWRKTLAPTHGTPGSGSWRRCSPLFRKGFLAPFVQKSLKMGLKLEAWIWLLQSPFLFQFVLWFVLP